MGSGIWQVLSGHLYISWARQVQVSDESRIQRVKEVEMALTSEMVMKFSLERGLEMGTRCCYL